MDYKYIEQLLERYWECQTTLEEEAILRNFFRQEDVPASLLAYRQLFVEEDGMAEERLSEDFAERMLRLVPEQPDIHALREERTVVCKARRMTFARRFRPFYRAAGLVAILLTIGDAAQQSFSEDEEAVASQQMAATAGADSLQDVAVGLPEQQSAALTSPTADTLNVITR